MVASHTNHTQQLYPRKGTACASTVYPVLSIRALCRALLQTLQYSAVQNTMSERRLCRTRLVDAAAVGLDEVSAGVVARGRRAATQCCGRRRQGALPLAASGDLTVGIAAHRSAAKQVTWPAAARRGG